MAKNKIIEVQQTSISITDFKGEDYICITDMAKAKTDDSRAADVIKNWIRTRTTLEFLGTWEKIYNPDFKVVEFDHFKSQAGLPSFVLSPSNLESINAVLIRQGLNQPERLKQLNQIAITQMTSLVNSSNLKKLK